MTEIQKALEALNEAQECFQPETLEELRNHFDVIKECLSLVDNAAEFFDCLSSAGFRLAYPALVYDYHDDYGAAPKEVCYNVKTKDGWNWKEDFNNAFRMYINGQIEKRRQKEFKFSK